MGVKFFSLFTAMNKCVSVNVNIELVSTILYSIDEFLLGFRVFVFDKSGVDIHAISILNYSGSNYIWVMSIKNSAFQYS